MHLLHKFFILDECSSQSISCIKWQLDVNEHWWIPIQFPLPTMLLPIRLYPAKYHFMPTQGQIQEVEIFLLQDTFNMGILCFKTSDFIVIDRIMLILEMIWSTKFELGTSNTSFIKSVEKPKYTNEEVHKYFWAPLHALEFSSTSFSGNFTLSR